MHTFTIQVFKKKIKRQKRKPEGEKVEGVGEDKEMMDKVGQNWYSEMRL